jgi:hypothetical protein
VADFDAKLRPHLEGSLEPGETLEGICACSQQKSMFSGGAVALGVTERRLIVQKLDRRGNPAGEAQSLTPGDIADVRASGAGGGWAEIGPILLDRTAVKLTLRTTSGEKLRLMMMRAEGSGAMAMLGGGEGQRRGVEALAGWFSRAERAQQAEDR